MQFSLSLLVALSLLSFNAQAARKSFTVSVISDSAPMYSKPDPNSEIIGYLQKGDSKLITSYFKIGWPKTYLNGGVPAYLDISDLKITTDAFFGHRGTPGHQQKYNCKPSPSDTSVSFTPTNFNCREGSKGYSSCSVSIAVNSQSACLNIGTSIITCETRVQYNQVTTYGKDSFINTQERLFPLIMTRGYAKAEFELEHSFGSMGYTTTAEVLDAKCELNLVLD